MRPPPTALHGSPPPPPPPAQGSQAQEVELKGRVVGRLPRRAVERCCLSRDQGLELTQVGLAGGEPCLSPGTWTWANGDTGGLGGGAGVSGLDPAPQGCSSALWSVPRHS